MKTAIALTLCWLTLMVARARAGNPPAPLQKAIEQLRADPKNGEAGKAAEEFLGEGQPTEVRLQAALALARHKLLPDQTAVALAALLKNSDGNIRNQAHNGLKMLGAAGSAAAPELVAMLRGDRGSMHYALLSLSHIKGDRDVVVPAVLRTFGETLPEALRNTRDAHLPRQAAYVLGKYPEAGPVITPVLTAAVKKFEGKAASSFTGKVQFYDSLFQTLAHVAPADELVKLYRDLKDDGLKNSMVRSLISDPVKLAPIAREALKSDDPRLRLRALVGLTSRQANKADLAHVAKLLKEKDEKLRMEACFLLERFKGDAIPLVVEALKDDPTLRPLLLAMVNNARTMLLSKATVPGLIACLEDSNQQVRYRACEALGRLGREARGAVPALKELAGGGPQFVRGAAEEALKRIEPK